MTTTVAAPARMVGARVPVARDPEHLRVDVLGAAAVALVVYGNPAPQGSKDGKIVYVGGKPRVVMYEAHKDVKPWRAAVLSVAMAVRPHDWEVLDCPLVADIVITLPRPKSQPKTLRTMPIALPDLDKLQRAVGDALGTDAKALNRPILADDSRIVEFRRACKVYEGDPYDSDALRRPGAVIRLWRYPPGYLGKMEALNG